MSTIPKTGIPRRLASLTAMCSFITSITKSAEGRRVRSAIEPRFFSSLARWRLICRISRLERLENVPSAISLSMLDIFLTALRIVGKLVSIPPGQRSITYGIFTDVAFSATISLACFLVATNKTFLPLLAIAFKASAASSIFTTVLLRSMIWIPLRSMKI